MRKLKHYLAAYLSEDSHMSTLTKPRAILVAFLLRKKVSRKILPCITPILAFHNI